MQATLTTPRVNPRGQSIARRIARNLIPNLLLIIPAAIMLLPIYWMIITALKPSTEIYIVPPTWIPSRLEFSNFARVLDLARFDRYFINTVVFAGIHTVLNLLFASMAGYGFARLRFPGQQPLFWLLLTKMMVPFYVVLIPLFILMRFFPLTGGNDLFGQGGSGLYDTVLGILLPGIITPFGIFMFRQFFLTLPRDLEDAARIDGCTEWQIYWRVMLPLTKPAIVTLAIFTFQGSWNMFIWPLVMTRTETLRTIQIALAFFRQDQNIQWALLMAATTMATLPIILVFLVLQRYFKQGIAMTGLKG